MRSSARSGVERWWQRPGAGYLWAMGGVGVATALRFALEPLLEGFAPHALYFPILVAVTWLFGVGPGLLAALLSWLAAYFATLNGSVSAASLLLYVFTSGAMIALCSAAAATRRSAMVALGDSERAHVERARLAAIVESSDDAIVSKDLDGFIQSWNRGAERLFGYSAEEVIGRSITILIPLERRFEEDHILMQLRRGERVDHFETVRVTKDGRALDISLSVSPIRNAQGEVVGASKIARDISERKRAERAIAEQRELFRVTLASIADAVITIDRHGLVSYMNNVAERLSGVPASEAQGKRLEAVFTLIDEKTRGPINELNVTALRAGSLLGHGRSALIVARNGGEYPIEDSSAPILGSDGGAIGLVVCFRDVSERRQAEARVAEQREWLETTLVSIGDAVIATDIHGRVTFMNPVAEHMTGWSTHEARGRDCADVFQIINEYTREVVENPVARVLREGMVVGLANHTVLISRDGRELPIDDSAAPIRNGEGGRIVGAVLVFHDISERRRAELTRQETEQQREHLLQSERAARGEAERLNLLKDQFVATVSHELRTPLNAILGWTDILKRSAFDQATFTRGLSVIERNARVQTQLVSDLLDVSRIMSGKLKLELSLVDLSAVIQDALDTVRSSLEAKSLRVERDVPSSFEQVLGDAARLQQIMWNLLTNAIKFTPQGGAVRVSLARDGEQARISVSDTGAGIRPDFLPHLFDRFRQADSSTTRRFGGLGLGLTIVKQLVELHGGSVCADSAGEGKGATFTVRLPLDAVPALDRKDSASLPPAAAMAKTLAGLRVLLVEDEPEARELVERLLSEAGCRVTAVGSASQTFEALRSEPHDLLISDLGLPEEDGYTLIARLRQAEAGSERFMPAIALTAFARSEDRTRALRAGFQAHIVKPFETAEVIATVASLAQLIRGQAQPKG
jgi:PAS domain S-box-containing protein